MSRESSGSSSARAATPAGRPLGTTALDLTTSGETPVVVVPPQYLARARVARILVPLSGSLEAARAPRRIVELAASERGRARVLHVHDITSLPLFTDQLQHEAHAWAEEFLARYVPGGSGARALRRADRFARRRGARGRGRGRRRPDRARVGRLLDAGRAPVVRALLARARHSPSSPCTSATDRKGSPAWTASRSSHV